MMMAAQVVEKRSPRGMSLDFRQAVFRAPLAMNLRDAGALQE